MNFDGSGYVQVADFLFRDPYDDTDDLLREAELRAAISRAYYGVFLKTRTYLSKTVQDPNIPNDYRVHKYVRNRIREIAKIRNKRNIGIIIYENLDNLRRSRNEADYEDPYQNLDDLIDEAETALIYANKILDNLKLL